MSVIKEFKEFALKGSVIDLAIGVVIGAGFAKIVDSFVNDILMPPLGLLTGPTGFADKFITLSGGHYQSLEQAKAAGAATINYGLFINTVVNFLIIAFVIFLIVKRVNAMRAEPADVPNTRDCPRCLSPIPLGATKCKHCTADL